VGGGSLERARRVQQRMLPRLPVLPGVELYAHYAPCDAVGGDFYDCVQAQPGTLALIVGDVAGHGLDAAIVMAAAKKSMQVHSQGRISPREVLGVVAHDLAPELPPGIFFTAVHAVLDLAAGTLRLGRAGHPDLLHLRPGRDPVLAAHRPNGAAIGMAPPEKLLSLIEEPVLQLAPGDTVVLYTDGIEEAMNGAREQYGDARMRARLAEFAALPPDALVTALLDDVAVHRDGTAPNDDVTILAMRWTGAPADVDAAPPGNLPAPAGRFIGRDDLLAGVAEALAPEGARVTLTGVGGMGKTRCAVEAARRRGRDLPGGAWFADLREARSADGVAYAVSQAFGLPLTQHATPPVQAVAELLAARPPLLLVCDNFEQVVPFAEATIGAWQRAAPQLRVLATSREPLRLAGETLIPLEPLPDLQACALLRDRAGLPDDAPAEPLAAIAAGLDGIPLALELAAAQLHRFDPANLQAMLRRKFEVLQGLEAAIGLGFDELHPESRAVLQQLTVFRGGATFETALRIVRCDGSLTARLQELVRARLVRTVVAHGTTRFDLLPTIREFAQRRWAEASAADRTALERRYAEHFAGYFAEWGERTRGPAAADALDRLEAEIENGLHAAPLAAGLGLGEAAARIAVALDGVLGMRGPAAPRVGTLQAALAACAAADHPGPHVRLRTQLSFAKETAGDWTGALADAEGAVALAAEADVDPLTRWRAVKQLAALRIFRGDYAPGLELLQTAGELADASGSAVALADTALLRAFVPLFQGNPAIGLPMLEAAEPVMRRLGCPRTNQRFAETCGAAYGMLGTTDRALACFTEALEMATELRDWWTAGRTLNNIALARQMSGDLDGAEAAMEEAEAWLRQLGNRHGIAAMQMLRADILRERGHAMEAADAAAPAVQTFRSAGDRRNESAALAVRGRALLEASDATSLAEARTCLRRALDLLDESGSSAPTQRFRLWVRLARAEAANGDANESRRRAAEALDLAEAEGIARDHPDRDVAAAWRELDALR
jgi:predicted ATPase